MRLTSSSSLLEIIRSPQLKNDYNPGAVSLANLIKHFPEATPRPCPSDCDSEWFWLYKRDKPNYGFKLQGVRVWVPRGMLLRPNDDN